MSDTNVWPPSQASKRPQVKRAGSRPPPRVTRAQDHKPISVGRLAGSPPEEAWKVVRWHPDVRGIFASQFAALRVGPAHRDNDRMEPHGIEWLLIEWPRGDCEPSR